MLNFMTKEDYMEDNKKMTHFLLLLNIVGTYNKFYEHKGGFNGRESLAKWNKDLKIQAIKEIKETL